MITKAGWCELETCQITSMRYVHGPDCVASLPRIGRSEPLRTLVLPPAAAESVLPFELPRSSGATNSTSATTVGRATEPSLASEVLDWVCGVASNSIGMIAATLGGNGVRQPAGNRPAGWVAALCDLTNPTGAGSSDVTILAMAAFAVALADANDCV